MAARQSKDGGSSRYASCNVLRSTASDLVINASELNFGEFYSPSKCPLPVFPRSAPTGKFFAPPESHLEVGCDPYSRILLLCQDEPDISYLDDARVMIAARQEARRNFDQNRRLGVDTGMQINHAIEVANILRHNIVQGAREDGDESAKWRMWNQVPL